MRQLQGLHDFQGLDSSAGHPRPPTLRFFGRRASSGTPGRPKYKVRATDFVIWLDVLILVLGASTFAVILKLAGMEL